MPEYKSVLNICDFNNLELQIEFVKFIN